VGKSYRYEARRSGFKPTKGVVRYTGTSEQVVSLRMEKLPEDRRTKPAAKREDAPRNTAEAVKHKGRGRLACSSNPPYADVYVDGKPTGRQTPIPLNNALELPVGTHKILFKLGAKSSAPQTVEIRENQIYPLRNVPIE
jgi:hypothetical protein